MKNKKEIEATLSKCSANKLEEVISFTIKKLGDIDTRTERMKHDPDSVMLEEKKEALQVVLRKYGSLIDCKTMSLERIALGVARIQGEEQILRSDIKRLSSKENREELKLTLDIAQMVLAEKKQHGGRN